MVCITGKYGAFYCKEICPVVCLSLCFYLFIFVFYTEIRSTSVFASVVLRRCIHFYIKSVLFFVIFIICNNGRCQAVMCIVLHFCFI